MDPRDEEARNSIEWDRCNIDYAHSISIIQNGTSLILRLPKPPGLRALHGHDLLADHDDERYQRLMEFLTGTTTGDAIYQGDGYAFVYSNTPQRVMIILQNGSVPEIQHNSSSTYLTRDNTKLLFDKLREGLTRKPHSNLYPF